MNATVAMRDRGVKWLDDKFKERHAPKNRDKGTSPRQETKKRSFGMNSFFIDNDENVIEKPSAVRDVEYDLSEVEHYLALAQ